MSAIYGRFAVFLLVMASKILAPGAVNIASQSTYNMTYSWDHMRIAYIKTINDKKDELYVADSSGVNAQFIFAIPHGNDSTGIWDVSWSPSGKELMFTIAYPDDHGFIGTEIKIINADGSGLHTVAGAHWVFSPVWLIDGQHIAFMQGMGGCFALYVSDLTGLNPEYIAGCTPVG